MYLLKLLITRCFSGYLFICTVTNQYKLVPAKQWYCLARKVTAGLTK